MKTPNLDREINDLSYYETNNELTDQGRNTIAEFREIKEQLRLHSVSNSVAADCAEFCVRCDRDKLPLLCLEDYIKQYCC